MEKEKYTTILADSNRDYLRLLTDFLDETDRFYIEDYAYDGRQAYELTMDKKPDLLIIDLIMPVYDGFAVLEELHKNGYNAKTKIVMMSAISIDFVLDKADSFNVDYIFLKPFDKQVFIKRILEIMQFDNRHGQFSRENRRADPSELVTRNIKTVGITANVKGYHYLREAILLVHEDEQMMNHLTTGLYSEVAKKYKTTPQRVERAMRHAIEAAWNRGNINVLEEFFGYTILDTKGKPTNGEFIAMFADKLNTELKYID